MELCFNSKNDFVPSTNRWIASLSDGSTVFEDFTPRQKSCWLRLKDYIEKHNLKITNLRLECFGRQVCLVPYKDNEGRPQINGYWQSKKLGALVNAGNGGQFSWRGVGFVKSKKIYMTWIREDGHIEYDCREYENGDPACILNDEV